MACDEWSRRIHENKAWRSFGLAELMLNYEVVLFIKKIEILIEDHLKKCSWTWKFKMHLKEQINISKKIIKRKKNSIMSFLELPHNFIHFILPFNVILILKH